MIMKSFNMKTDDLKHADISKLDSFELGRDDDSRLYMKKFRELFSPLKRDMTAVEALSALRFAGRSLRLLQERWAERHGLSEGRIGVLFRLKRGGDMPLGELADDLDSSPRNITGLVDHLERDGLVERVPDPTDRRSVRARLTAEGRALIDRIWEEGMEHQREVVGALSKDDLAQLRHLCLMLVENARKELGK